MTHLFVYGTLKRGQRAAARLARQRFVGAAQTGPGLVLYELDGYPGLVREPAAADGVVGEVWLVDAKGLCDLDAYEGVGEGLYRRESIALVTPGLPETVETYVYARSVAGRTRIGSAWPPTG